MFAGFISYAVDSNRVQINGNRGDTAPELGGANIVFGGVNHNQTIQYVRSYDPRSWSCLHITEGPFTCTNATVQNNDIGPCGVELSDEWADGISVSCKDSVVRNNMVMNPTDGGIVIFGSPGTQVYNNTIWVTNVCRLSSSFILIFRPHSLPANAPRWHQHGRLSTMGWKLHEHCRAG